jgi:TRAP-type C4-dicarboxylate transport system substrate-binding protein
VEDTQCLQSATRELYKAYFDKLGVHLLYSAPWPATGLWSATPVQTMPDLRALHIRTYDETAASFLKSVGVDGVHMPLGKALPLIATGEITGVMSSGDGGVGQRFWEHLPYFIELNYAAPLSFAVLNASTYASLTEAERHQVDEAARRTEQRLWVVMEDRLSQNYQVMHQHNVTIQPMTAALKTGLEAASQRAIKEWSAAAGPDGQELLRRYEAFRPVANRSHDATVCSK